MNKNRKGFTLVELLAVITIISLILIIAVPKVLDTINNSKKETFELTARSIASAAEKKYVDNYTAGVDEEILCHNVVDINDIDYEYCDVEIYNDEAKVNIKGKGKYNGLYICGGTKINASVTDEECPIMYGKGTTYITKLLSRENTLHNGLIVDDTVDENIRYAGPLTGDNAVKNQVYFNCAPNDGTNDYGTKNYKYADKCETWRIIGVFNTKSTKDENEKPVPRIKIVRNNILDTTMEWDTTADGVEYINQWGETTLSDKTTPYAGASLMQYLNGDYHNSLTSIAQGQINDALWYTGAVAKDTASGVYTAERSEAKGTGTTVEYTTTWVGKIGLIYPSDFGYAGTNCGDKTIYDYDASCGKTSNWLTISSIEYWTISPNASYSNRAWRVRSSGYAGYYYVNNTFGVRPALYLSSKVQIIGGDGTDVSPYILSNN